MAATRDEFAAELERIFNDAEQLDLNFIGVSSRALHRRVGGYPGRNHRMPVCCDAMRAAMCADDRIVRQPPKGDGASLLIHYVLPRSTLI